MNEKKTPEKRLEGHIPADLRSRIDDFLNSHPQIKKKDFMRSMAELFIELPPELQEKIIAAPTQTIKDIAKRMVAHSDPPLDELRSQIQTVAATLDRIKKAFET